MKANLSRAPWRENGSGGNGSHTGTAAPPAGPATPGPGTAARWRRSSFCRGDACVEVTVTTDTSGWPHKADCDKLYLMRDTKNPDGPVLAFTPAEWEAFVLGVKDGEFDIAGGEFQNSP